MSRRRKEDAGDVSRGQNGYDCWRKNPPEDFSFLTSQIICASVLKNNTRHSWRMSRPCRRRHGQKQQETRWARVKCKVKVLFELIFIIFRFYVVWFSSCPKIRRFVKKKQSKLWTHDDSTDDNSKINSFLHIIGCVTKWDRTKKENKAAVL